MLKINLIVRFGGWNWIWKMAWRHAEIKYIISNLIIKYQGHKLMCRKNQQPKD